MRKLTVFNFVTMNGFFAGPGGDISWHKDNDPEKNEYAEEGIESKNTLIFGRVTYEMMAGFWPSADALKYAPVMAKGMNAADKIVFSKTLEKADWNNTRLVNGDMVEEIKKMKQMEGKDMTILGSGSIISQLTDEGLIDEYQIMLDPVAIGEGTPLFKNIRNQLDLKLTDTRIFKSGVILLSYEPIRK